MEFKLQAPFQSMGDQPEAIRGLVDGENNGMKHQILLGATGPGKTFTIASVIRQVQKRAAGTHPWTLIDSLPSDYLLVIDESHMTVPQVRGMYNGDRSRKEILVEYGFRLPSAMDNRPLNFDEFEEVMGSTIYTSATPGPYEMGKAECFDKPARQRLQSFRL